MPKMKNIIEAMEIISKTDKGAMEKWPVASHDQINLPGNPVGMDSRDLKKLDQLGVHWHYEDMKPYLDAARKNITT